MGEITKIVNIPIGCIPENPVCLRWVNSHGMLEHWVFGVNQMYSLSTKDGDLIRLNFTDYADQKALTKILSRESVREIKLQAFDLDKTYIDGLSSLLESNHIELLLDKEDLVWQEVKIKAGSYDLYQSKVLVFNWEATIQLPERLIQNY